MPSQARRTQFFPSKTRVFIVSDISNEPDDAESLVRYLLYSNQFQTKGLVACTSTWMKRKTCPQDMRKIVHAYAKVVENLNAHVHPDCPYLSGSSMASLIKTGPSVSPLLLAVVSSLFSGYWGGEAPTASDSILKESHWRIFRLELDLSLHESSHVMLTNLLALRQGSPTPGCTSERWCTAPDRYS